MCAYLSSESRLIQRDIVDVTGRAAFAPELCGVGFYLGVDKSAVSFCGRRVVSRQSQVLRGAYVATIYALLRLVKVSESRTRKGEVAVLVHVTDNNCLPGRATALGLSAQFWPRSRWQPSILPRAKPLSPLMREDACCWASRGWHATCISRVSFILDPLPLRRLLLLVYRIAWN